MNERCELVHSVASDSAARRLTVPVLLEVNLSGEESKSGVSPEEVGAYVERYPNVRGLMMPPLAETPTSLVRGSAGSASLPSSTALWAVDGHVAGLARRGRGRPRSSASAASCSRRRQGYDRSERGLLGRLEPHSRLLRHRRGRRLGRGRAGDGGGARSRLSPRPAQRPSCPAATTPTTGATAKETGPRPRRRHACAASIPASV